MTDSTPIELEVYKLAVEMADRVSARRGLANTFFLTLNTALAALLGGAQLRWYAAAAGIVLATAWWALLQSYRRLNRAKFSVIVAIEQRLPLRIFSDEWEELSVTRPVGEGFPRRTLRRLADYRELGAVERVVPVVFIAIYVTELIRQAVE